MDTDLQRDISQLLAETGAAHHDAFAASSGEDPDWPIWYAGHAQKALNEKLSASLTKSQLVYCLMNADFERQARAPEAEWSAFYAQELLTRYAPSRAAEEDVLALYHFDGCPFCRMVRGEIERLGVDVELRDVMADDRHRSSLIAERGRGTVPVLRITAPGGEERWLPESRDIVRYLNEHYG